MQVDDPVQMPRGGESRSQAVAPQQTPALGGVPAPQAGQIFRGGVPMDGHDTEAASKGLLDDVPRGLRCDDGDLTTEFAGRLGDGQHHDLTAAHASLVGGDGECGHPTTSR